MRFFDDGVAGYAAKLKPPQLVLLRCPACPAVVVGQGSGHAMELLAIHREGTCPGGGERG